MYVFLRWSNTVKGLGSEGHMGCCEHALTVPVQCSVKILES